VSAADAADAAGRGRAGGRPGATVNAVRLGLRRGWIEMKQSLSTRADQVWLVLVNGIFIAVLWFQRDATIPGTDISLALATLPSLIGMNILFGGWMGTAQTLSVEREDGTLLRSKSTPDGMVGYLVARITLAALNTGLGTVVFVAAGFVILDGLEDVPVTGWLQVLVLFVLGLLATLPWGAVLGSLVNSSQAGFGLSFLPAAVMIAISGIFYPISGLPDWLHPIAQIFPVYWLGLGMRAALSPEAAAAAEIGGEWRHLETYAVLGVWAVVGLVLAPRILRRMARRESGSAVEERRQRAIQQFT
jgi:ABC-2 type transport system permease protein